MRPQLAFRLVTISMALVAAGPAAAQTGQPGAAADTQIARQVASRIVESRIQGVEVTVLRGNAILRGTVRSLWEKQRAAEEALSVREIMMVDNDLVIERGGSDERIAGQVNAGIGRCVFLTIFDDVIATVDDGTVTLTGHVTVSEKADAAADMASRVPGVQQVRNRIETLPSTHIDEQVRYAVARRLYADPAFWPHAVQLAPAIRILVEHGHVTLTGTVTSDADRTRAQSIAASTVGVLSVKNRLRVRSEPATWE